MAEVNRGGRDARLRAEINVGFFSEKDNIIQTVSQVISERWSGVEG